MAGERHSVMFGKKPSGRFWQIGDTGTEKQDHRLPFSSVEHRVLSAAYDKRVSIFQSDRVGVSISCGSIPVRACLRRFPWLCPPGYSTVLVRLALKMQCFYVSFRCAIPGRLAR